MLHTLSHTGLEHKQRQFCPALCPLCHSLHSATATSLGPGAHEGDAGCGSYCPDSGGINEIHPVIFPTHYSQEAF